MPNDDFVSRLITAGEAVGPTRPQLAHTLASSDLSHGEIQAVGGFAQAMALATANRLAADSGARTNFNSDERNQLDGVREPIAGAEAEGEIQDSRSWLEQAVDKVAGYASNTFSLLLHNPVSDLAFDAFRELGNAAHMPFRLLSDAVDGSNSDEIDTSMQRQGYDPDSTTSYLAFMWNKGESQYHDLGAARDVYGDEMIDAVLQAQADPEQFQSDYEHMVPEEAAKLGQIMESPDWAQAYDAVNRQHISPGRDVARILTLGHTDNAAFTFLSGTLDAAYTWFTDPTLVLGKGVQAARAMDATTGALAAGSRFAPSNLAARGIDKLRGGNQRAGLTSMADQAGIERLLRVENGQAVTQVGKGWESFLGQASELRKQNKISRNTSLSDEVRAEAEAKRAGIFRGMQSQYGPLMPLLDAINGKRVVSEATSTGGRIDGLASGHVVENGDPIETLDDLAKYLVSTDGLLSLHNGMAARRQIIMPGRLSWAAEKRAARAGKRAERWIDYTKANALLPDEAEIPLAEAMAKTAGKAQHDLLTKSMFTSARAARAKAERVSRRFSTILPRVNHIDLTDSSSSKVVEQVARMYLNRGDAARLASAYALGDMAARRNILRGVLVQSFHASGLAKSPAGKAFMERFIGDQADLARQQYGMGDTSKILTERGEVQAALYPDQLSTKVLIPSYREMSYLATKFAVAGFAGKSGWAHVRAIAQAPGTDRLIGTIKLGWITTAAGGLRNALDEVANFAATGLGRETLAARSTFTQATKELRDKRREYSREYLAMASRNGRDLADETVARRVGEGLKSHADAKLALERAKNAEQALANVPNALAGRVSAAAARVEQAKEFNFRALDAFEKGKAAGLPEEQLAPLRADAQRFADELVTAREALRSHKRAADNPDKSIAKAQESIDRRNIPSVKDAEADLKAAEREMKHARGLESAVRHRLPYAFRMVADNVNDVLTGVVLGKLVSFMGSQYKITDRDVKYAQELLDAELTRTLHEGVFQAHYADSVLLETGDEGAMALHRAGLRARKYAYGSKSLGWGQVEPDGGAGLDAWAKTLQLRFADEKSPAHAWAQTLRALHKPDEEILDETGKAIGSMSGMSHADWQAALDAAKQSVRLHLDEDDLRHFVANAEVFKQTKAGVKVGDDAELQSLAKDEYADRVSADLLLTLGRQDPNGGIYINRGLLDELADGRVPDRSWLSQLSKDERPEHTIGQLWAPYNPNHAPGTMPAGYSQMLTKAYDKVVTDQINALSRNPLMTALYINARKNTRGYEKKLTEAGWDEQSAAEVTKRIALAHAQDEAFKHIDNPHVASQFSTIGRNYFAFVRAQEDWLRRWGRTIRDNPQVIRQAQLLIHGGTSTGMVEKDDQDNLVFVYPASGLILGILNKVLPGAAQIPMNGELTSQLQFLNPSLDNPLGFSGTPLVSLPFKIMTAILGPDHALLTASMDKVVNGELGAGREWYEQLMPSWVNRIIGGVISEDPASKYGAAYTQALANMEAAGQLDDPELQTASGKARFQDALSVGIKNNLAAMALFGFFAPAAPALNAEASAVADGQQGNRPDFSAHEIGLRTLKDEARRVFAELPYEEALAWWQAVHPRELIYALTGDSSRTQAGTKNASAPATIAAARWMEQNGDFTAAFGGKGGIAAYFIPQGAADTVNGSYSDVAYRAQLETGMREHKSLDDYFDDIVTARGAAIYFAAKDEYDQARSAAQGSPSRQAALDAQWQATKDEIYQGNPLLAEKQAEYATANASTQGQLAQVYKMIQSDSPVVSRALGANRDGVLQMLMAYESFKATTGQLGDRRGNVANRRRQQAKDAYESTIKALSTQYPDLADLGRGVFRLP